MATLQKIRTKAGLLVAIVIGISLAAFILGDVLRQGKSVFQRDRLEVGEIDGESIQYTDFQQKSEELAEMYRLNSGLTQNQLDEATWVQIREQTWQNIVREIVMSDVFDDLGIDVSSDELFDMIQGSNLSPIVQSLFMDPNTGQVDRNAILSFLRTLENGATPETRNYWLYMEKQIVDDRNQTKYNNLVAKGLYVTTEVANESLSEKNKQVNFDYVMLSHSSVADSQVVVTDQELRDYYNNHKSDYEQTKQRTIEYITFPIIPSASDYNVAEDWINDIKSDFQSTNDDVQFVNSNSDVSFDDTWYKQGELPENLDNWIFTENADTNDVFGPYFENDSYILAKLHAIQMLPDSVKARHILLDGTEAASMEELQALADSIKTAIENGSDFATLAMQFSKDGTASIGGELGWFTRDVMVKEFSDAAFSNDINEVSIAVSQFGMHIIQTTDRSKLLKHVQVAQLIRNVTPSTQTYQDIYSDASRFAGDNTTKEKFDAAITEQDLDKKVAVLGENDQDIAGLDNARPLIRAAYDTKEGNIIISQQESPIFELGDNYVIAALTKVTEEGTSPFDDVKSRVELNVLKEKKAKYLADKMNNVLNENTDMEGLATELGTTVENAANITFSSFQLPGVGLEPVVIGTATNMAADQISEPIEGNNGVFVIKVISENELADQDVESEQTQLEQSYFSRASSLAYQVHRESIDVQDKRSKFF